MSMNAAVVALLVGSARGMDTSSQPGDDITVVTDTPAVHRVSSTARCAVCDRRRGVLMCGVWCCAA